MQYIAGNVRFSKPQQDKGEGGPPTLAQVLRHGDVAFRISSSAESITRITSVAHKIEMTIVLEMRCLRGSERGTLRTVATAPPNKGSSYPMMKRLPLWIASPLLCSLLLVGCNGANTSTEEQSTAGSSGSLQTSNTTQASGGATRSMSSGIGTGGSTATAANGGAGGEPTSAPESSIGGQNTGGQNTGGSDVGSTGGSTTSTTTLSPLPSQASVLEAMRRANTYFVSRWPDPTVSIVSTDRTRPSNLWTRAIYYEGLMALYAVEPDATKKQSYYDYAVAWGQSPDHPWTLTYTAAATMTSNADNQACGQTYIDLYRIDPQAERLKVIQANVDDMVSKGTTNVWTWIDAIQMSMPVFAKLGKLTGNTAYYDTMWGLYAYARNQCGGGLFNTSDGLWWRDHHFTATGGTATNLTLALHDKMPGSGTDAYLLSPNGKQVYWSRGNGWVMAALVRVLDELPATDSHRDQYVADFRAMAKALLPIQRADGFWNESLVDANHCGALGITGQDGPETSGTALFVYGLAWGLRTGLLDQSTYGAAVEKGWNGLVSTALQSSGLVGYVQSTGDRPCTGPAPLGATTLANFDDYGVGCFILAGSEVYRLAPN